MRVKWATTCEQATRDERGAHSITGVGVSHMRAASDAAAGVVPIFACLAVPQHELGQELEVIVIVSDPRNQAVGTQSGKLTIPPTEVPEDAPPGFEILAYLSADVSFTITTEGAYSVYVTPPLNPGDQRPDALTLFVSRS